MIVSKIETIQDSPGDRIYENLLFLVANYDEF
jgi:hypothetical protein